MVFLGIRQLSDANLRFAQNRSSGYELIVPVSGDTWRKFDEAAWRGNAARIRLFTAVGPHQIAMQARFVHGYSGRTANHFILNR
jgi:hypothetical protein